MSLRRVGQRPSFADPFLKETFLALRVFILSIPRAFVCLPLLGTAQVGFVLGWPSEDDTAFSAFQGLTFEGYLKVICRTVLIVSLP